MQTFSLAHTVGQLQANVRLIEWQLVVCVGG